jgi:Flp pilus assembly protein TadD
LLAAGDTLRAEQYALLAIREGYPEERAIVPLVRACIGSSRLRTALVHAEPFLRKHPEDNRLRYLTATVHLGLGNAQAAERELHRVWRLRPEMAEPHHLGGVIARDAFGNVGEARARFERYLALAPDGVHAPEVRMWLSEQPSQPAADSVSAKQGADR